MPVHGEGNNKVQVKLKNSQDLITDAAGQQAWAARLERLLRGLQATLLAQAAA